MFVLGVEVLDEPILGFFGLLSVRVPLGFADSADRRAACRPRLPRIDGHQRRFLFVVTGTAAASTTWVAVAGMAVVAFVVRLVGSFRRLLVASVTPGDPRLRPRHDDTGVGPTTSRARRRRRPRRLRPRRRPGAVAARTQSERRMRPPARSTSWPTRSTGSAGRAAPADDQQAIRDRLHARHDAAGPVRPSGPECTTFAIRLVIDDVRPISGALLRPGQTTGPPTCPRRPPGWSRSRPGPRRRGPVAATD